MKPRWQRLIFGLVIFLAVLGGIGHLSFTAAQEKELKADAGPDQTVPSPSPVMVAFSGKANSEDYACVWRNQWNMMRSEACDTNFHVNFGKNPKPGTKRSFKLEVLDVDTGQSASDWVTITLDNAQSARAPTPTPTATPTPARTPAPTPQCPDPTVTTSAASASPGDAVTVSGEGWIPGGEVRLSLVDGGKQVNIGTVSAVPDSGRWETTFTVPDEPYSYSLQATEDHEGCLVYPQTAFEVLQGGDPADSQGVVGAWHSYEVWGGGGNGQSIGIGRLDDGRWYVSSSAGGESLMWGYPAIAQCHYGAHWEAMIDDVRDREGCVGSESPTGIEANIGELVVLIDADNGAWVISDRNTYEPIVTLTPRVTGLLWEPTNTYPLN